MKDRRLMKYGAYGLGVAGIIVLFMGLIDFVTKDSDTGLLQLGFTLLNTALLLRVLRWEVNE